MNLWSMSEYRRAYSDFYDDCDADLRTEIDARYAQLRELGNLCERPVSEALGDSLFAMRAKSARHQARFIYCFPTWRVRTVLFLVSVFKKTRAIDPAAISRAKAIRLQLEQEALLRHGIHYLA